MRRATIGGTQLQCSDTKIRNEYFCESRTKSQRHATRIVTIIIILSYCFIVMYCNLRSWPLPRLRGQFTKRYRHVFETVIGDCVVRAARLSIALDQQTFRFNDVSPRFDRKSYTFFFFSVSVKRYTARCSTFTIIHVIRAVLVKQRDFYRFAGSESPTVEPFFFFIMSV